jgi:RNA polymerase sigma-70 factor (ECF subfamily)
LNREDKLFVLTRSGDLKAFEVMFKTFYPELCNYAYQFAQDKETAEEIVQDLFYKLWEKKESIMIRSSIRSYLYRSVYNNAMMLIREKNIRKTTNTLPEDSQMYPGHMPDEQLETLELNRVVESTLSAMPKKVRKIFEMSRFEGLKYKEIADRLLISIKTVEASMGKALKLFRENLKEYYE